MWCVGMLYIHVVGCMLEAMCSIPNAGWGRNGEYIREKHFRFKIRIHYERFKAYRLRTDKIEYIPVGHV